MAVLLAEAGFPRAVAQASGEGNLTVRTGQLDEAGTEQVERAVTGVGGQVTQLRDEFIGPTIGAELRRKAVVALGIALVALVQTANMSAVFLLALLVDVLDRRRLLVAVQMAMVAVGLCCAP